MGVAVPLVPPRYALMVCTETTSPRLSLPEMKNKLRAPVASAQERRFKKEQIGRLLGPKRRYGRDGDKLIPSDRRISPSALSITGPFSACLLQLTRG